MPSKKATYVAFSSKQFSMLPTTYTFDKDTYAIDTLK